MIYIKVVGKVQFTFISPGFINRKGTDQTVKKLSPPEISFADSLYFYKMLFWFLPKWVLKIASSVQTSVVFASMDSTYNYRRNCAPI